jgi:addiction module HigA family antidote
MLRNRNSPRRALRRSSAEVAAGEVPRREFTSDTPMVAIERSLDAEAAVDPQQRPEYRVRRPLQRPPVHPGVLMREILEDHVKLSISEAARRMRISRPALYGVLNGTSAVTAEMALRFGRLTGGTPELYLNMQIGHDLEAAEVRLKAELAQIAPAATAS